MRLNRYLALCGLGSRRAVEDFIRLGQVRVNGKEETDLARRIEPGDRVEVSGRLAEPPREKTVIAFNKPMNCICAKADPRGRPVVYDWLPPEFKTLHHVGRLDFGSRGLLLFTNDGELTHRLLHPSFEVLRIYHVLIDRALAETERRELEAGVEIEPGVMTGRAEARPLPGDFEPGSAGYEMRLREGKNREIRRMLEVFGRRVIDLQRIAYGGIRLGNLPEGRYRLLEARELEILHPAPSSSGARRGPLR